MRRPVVAAAGRNLITATVRPNGPRRRVREEARLRSGIVVGGKVVYPYSSQTTEVVRVSTRSPAHSADLSPSAGAVTTGDLHLHHGPHRRPDSADAAGAYDLGPGLRLDQPIIGIAVRREVRVVASRGVSTV